VECTVGVVDEVTPDGQFGLLLVSLGVGTKFLGPELLYGARHDAGQLLRDCHAEVLAKRGLQAFLTRQVAAHSARPAAASAPPHLRPFSWLDSAGGLLHLRPRLVMYTSSMPCGNACLKRWAKGHKERFRDDLGTYCVF
jgi:double-stranded RNA-specific adenosine deaminase